MMHVLKKLVLGSPLENVVRGLLRKPKIAFKSSPFYWEQRYQIKGNSGAGSYGRLADFKAHVINDFVHENSINSVIEFGCGDGNQLALANYPDYIGVDVSNKAVELCKEKFSGDESKTFLVANEYNGERAQLSMSLDVIYHLIEDRIYEEYMRNLFAASDRFVVIYSSNYEDDRTGADHVRHRLFTDWVDRNIQGVRLIKKIPNRYPYLEIDPENTSFADFYFYDKI